jgi:tetratricopeptide (TPR) repeat protein
MGLFDAPSRSTIRDHGDIYRDKADRLVEETQQLFTQGRMTDAEEKVRELINLQSRVVGERHPEYATSLCMLAEILAAQDELTDAETLLQRALEIRRKALGERDADYAAALDQLARLMLRWEDHSGAEPLLREALEVRRDALGQDHPDYAASLAILAELLRKRDEPDESERLFRESLAVRRRLLGETHPDVADTLCGLADVLQRKNRFSEAETLLRQAIDHYRGELGETHPQHIAALSALASLLQKKGDLDGAEPIWRLLLDMKRQSLGDRHTDCASIQTQLGHLLQRRGDLKGAESLLRHAAETNKQTLGDRHPEYALGLTNLGLLLQRMGDLAGAEPLLRQALAVRKEVLGSRHPDYATSLVNLAQLVEKRGDASWSRMLLKEAVDVRRAVFGEDHPEYAQSLAALGDAFGQQGENAKAEALLRQALEIRRVALGEDHPIYAGNLSSLAGILRRMNDLEGAETLLRQALHIRKKTLGEDHPDYATNVGNLAWLLQRRGDREGARALLSESLEIRRRLLGEHHPEFKQNLERLQILQQDHPSSDVGNPPQAPPHVQFSRMPAQPPRAMVPEPIDESAPMLEEVPTETGPGILASAVSEVLGEDRLATPLDEDSMPSVDPDASTMELQVLPVFDGYFAESLEREPRTEVESEVENDEPVTEGSVDFQEIVEPLAEAVVHHDTIPETSDEPIESEATYEPSVVDRIEVIEDVASEEVAEWLPTAPDSVTAEEEEAASQAAEAVGREVEIDQEQESPVPDHRFSPVLRAPASGELCAEDAVPARSPSMSQSSSLLSHELAGMSDRFSELSERLLAAARQLHAPGTPLPDDLLEALNASRNAFLSLRDRAHELAGTLELPCPPTGELKNLADLTTLLEQAAEAEIHQSTSEELRRRALSVLDRVLVLSHVSDPDFTPLRQVHDKARDLRVEIAEGSSSTLPADAKRIAEGEHEFVDLLALIFDRDELPDEIWAAIHEKVSQSFGTAIAAAAARSKLVLPANPDGHAAGHDEMALAGADRDQA